MTALQKLQKRLSELPENEREAIAAHLLDEWEAQQWDKQIEADAEAGKLDHLIEQARDDAEAGRTLPMEFLTGEVTYDRIKHLAGSLEGPGDLLSNPKYMDDFGKSSMR